MCGDKCTRHSPDYDRFSTLLLASTYFPGPGRRQTRQPPRQAGRRRCGSSLSRSARPSSGRLQKRPGVGSCFTRGYLASLSTPPRLCIILLVPLHCMLCSPVPCLMRPEKTPAVGPNIKAANLKGISYYCAAVGSSSSSSV